MGKKYIAGKYLRLSDEDRNKNNAWDNSESIENQNRICDQWLELHPEVELYDTYIDDGCTGLDYDRAGYQRMKRDLDAGRINLILVKSLMRFGREQVETLTLFKREFVLKEIRFVAVVDGIDYEGTEADDGISIPVRIMMNDYYSKHTSIDIRASLKVKRSEGLFVGAFASYGYLKDPDNKNHLIIDPYASRVVKRIFDLFLFGNNIKFIAQTLNEEGILNPSDYKAQVQKLNFVVPTKLPTTRYWTYSTVKMVLKNAIYTGSVVQHTKEKVAYNLKKYRSLPKEEWVIVPDMHEAIISKEKFDKVQMLMEIRTTKITRECISPYAGIIFCGDCGRAMSKQQFEGKKGFRYRCGTYARIGKQYRSQHAIYTRQIDQMIIKEIKQVLDGLSDQSIERIRERAAQKDKRLENRNLELLKKKLAELEEEKKEIIRLLAKKTLAENDYMLYNEEYERETAQLKCQISEAKERAENAKASLKEYESFVENFLKYRNVTEVSRELVVNLIEKITVFENQKVHIKFLFKNPFED